MALKKPSGARHRGDCTCARSIWHRASDDLLRSKSSAVLFAKHCQGLGVSLTVNFGRWRNEMGPSHFDPAARYRRAWNAGKKVGTKRPLKQIWAIRFFLDRERRLGDRALFDLAIDSKLRG
jgi:hypothetical protein